MWCLHPAAALRLRPVLLLPPARTTRAPAPAHFQQDGQKSALQAPSCFEHVDSRHIWHIKLGFDPAQVLSAHSVAQPVVHMQSFSAW